MVEIDGPWWGEREAAYLRQVARVQAAAAGADVPDESFEIEWTVGAGPGDGPAGNFLPPADGLEALAASYGVEVQSQPADEGATDG